MKILIFTTLLVVISFSVKAENYYPQATVCEWLSDAAIAIAQNRDNGIEEYDLIGKYISEGTSYSEQTVIISLINRVYEKNRGLAPDEVAFAEQQRCEVAFVQHNR